MNPTATEPTGGKRLLVSVPTGPEGSINHALFKFGIDLSAHGIEGWDIRVDAVSQRPVAATRNRQIREFLWETDADYLLCIDDDMVPGVADLAEMLKEIVRPDVDVVSAMTLRQDAGGPTPVVFQFKGDGCTLNEEILSKEGGMYEIVNGGVPGACLLAPRYVYQDMYDKGILWHEDILFKDPADKKKFGNRKIGHDQRFCMNCNEMGFRTWIRSDIMWGHLKTLDLRYPLDLLLEIMTAKKELQEVRRENLWKP